MAVSTVDRPNPPKTDTANEQLKKLQEILQSGDLVRFEEYLSANSKSIEDYRCDQGEIVPIDRISILHWAALAKDVGIVKYLIENGFDINQKYEVKDSNSNSTSILTPLQYVICYKGTLGMAKFLLDSDATCSELENDSFQNSILAIAIKHSRYAIVLYLLENGYDLKVRNSKGETFMHYLMETGQCGTSLRVCGLISHYGGDVNAKDTTNGETPAHKAFKLKNFSLGLITSNLLLFSPTSDSYVPDNRGNHPADILPDKLSSMKKSLKNNDGIACSLLKYSFYFFMQLYITYIFVNLPRFVGLTMECAVFWAINLLGMLLMKKYVIDPFIVMKTMFLFKNIHFLVLLYFYHPNPESKWVFLHNMLIYASFGSLFGIYLMELVSRILQNGTRTPEMVEKFKREFFRHILKCALEQSDKQKSVDWDHKVLFSNCTFCATESFVDSERHCTYCNRCVSGIIHHSLFFGLCLSRRNIVFVQCLIFCTHVLSLYTLYAAYISLKVHFWEEFLEYGLWHILVEFARAATLSYNGLVLLASSELIFGSVKLSPRITY